ETFLDFINKIPFYGLSVLCADDPYLAALLPRVTKRYQTYGLTPSADLIGTDVQLHIGVAEFSARLRGEPLGRFKVAMPGIHNVRNALAAIEQAAHLFLTDISPAGEAPIPGVTGERLAEAIRRVGSPPLTYGPRKDQLVEAVLPVLKPGDVVVALGAGDIGQIGRALFERLG